MVSTFSDFAVFIAILYAVNLMQKGKSAKSRTVAISSGMEQVETACDSLLSMLNVIQAYVNDVVVSVLFCLLCIGSGILAALRDILVRIG